MTWRLFLDDERETSYVDPNGVFSWVIARTSAEALELVRERGMPEYASFDHDLGILLDGSVDDTMLFLKALAWEVEGAHPFSYGVHSSNPMGAANIRSFMESWKKSME